MGRLRFGWKLAGKIAAVALLHGAILGSWPGLSPAQQENPVVARVNQREIRLSDVYKEIEALPLGDQIDLREQLGRFTDSLITEEVLFQWARAGDFGGDEELRGRVKRMVVEYMIEKHVRQKIRISDDEIRSYYAANRDVVRGLHVRIRLILLKSRAVCEKVLGRINSEEDFAREAAALSLDQESAAEGGDIGWMMPIAGQRSLGFELELFRMKVGEMRAFETARGCNLVRITEFQDPPDPPLEQLRNIVGPILAREQEQNLLQALISLATSKVQVERIPLPPQ